MTCGSPSGTRTGLGPGPPGRAANRRAPQLSSTQLQRRFGVRSCARCRSVWGMLNRAMASVDDEQSQCQVSWVRSVNHTMKIPSKHRPRASPPAPLVSLYGEVCSTRVCTSRPSRGKYLVHVGGMSTCTPHAVVCESLVCVLCSATEVAKTGLGNGNVTFRVILTLKTGSRLTSPTGALATQLQGSLSRRLLPIGRTIRERQWIKSG